MDERQKNRRIVTNLLSIGKNHIFISGHAFFNSRHRQGFSHFKKWREESPSWWRQQAEIHWQTLLIVITNSCNDKATQE